MASPSDRRGAPRAPAPAWVTLTAVNCRQAAAGSRIHATLTDMSRDAVGLVVAGKLWRGDRLTLCGRPFEVTLRADVIIASVRAGAEAGETVVGCGFIDLTGEQRISIERILLGRLAQDDLGLGARFAIGA